MARVDVVIVNWNGRDDTLRAIEAVTAQNLPPTVSRFDVTIVDNGSSDGSVEAVSSRYPAVRVLRHAVNRGFTGGVRTGAEASESDLLILLNNDAVPEKGWLEALVGAMQDAPPDVIAVGGRIVDPTGRLADFVRGGMTFDGHAFQIGFRRPLEEIAEIPPGSEILFACGGNMIVRRNDFLEAGGFDDAYFAYLEDVDFGWRSWIAGKRILWAPEATVRHRSSATSDRLGAFERGVLFERNALQTVLKNCSEERFAAMSGAMFYAALHRLHHYAVNRNEGTSRLRRPPLDEASIERPPGESLLSRMARRVGLRIASRTPSLDDELTAMQFRALDWFFRNSDQIMERRLRVQASRKRRDEEIFERFPLLVVPTYPGDETLLSGRLFDSLLKEFPHQRATLDQIMKRP